MLVFAAMKRAVQNGRGHGDLSMTASFSEAERAAVYRAIATRRDVRRGYLPQPLPDDVLHRLLAAAHTAPSVGFMQPTRFILIRDPSVRQTIHEIFQQSNTEAAGRYKQEQRQQYADLKLEGILEAPQNLCVVCDAHSERGHGLGRQTMPETALYSTVCAIQNLWLAARAEGVGVGWVSILNPERVRETLAIPQHLVLVAYLCIGYVEEFAAQPDLECFGWEERAALATIVSYDRYSGADKG